MIPPALGTYGNMTRIRSVANGLHIWDFSVIKEYKMTERFGAEFRLRYSTFSTKPKYANRNLMGPGGNDPWTSPSQFGTALATPDVSKQQPVDRQRCCPYGSSRMKLSF